MKLKQLTNISVYNVKKNTHKKTLLIKTDSCYQIFNVKKYGNNVFVITDILISRFACFS